MLVSARHASPILDVCTMREPNCPSHLFMIRDMIRFRLSNTWKECGVKSCKWDVDKLQVDGKRQEFQNKLELKFLETLQGGAGGEVKCQKLNETVKMVAHETIGMKSLVRNKEWMINGRRQSERETKLS